MNLIFKYNLEKDIHNFLIANKSLGHGGKPSKMQILYHAKKIQDFFINPVTVINRSSIKKTASVGYSISRRIAANCQCVNCRQCDNACNK